MDIGQIKQVVQNYLNGKASTKERKWIERWLDKTEQEAKSMPYTGEYAWVKVQILQRLRKHTPLSVPVTSPKRQVLFRGVNRRKFAVVSLVLLAIVCFTGYQYRGNLLGLATSMNWVTVTASAWEIEKVTLPDSSIVILNTSGKLTFPRHFKGDNRKVCLTGEAYFDVKRNPEKPFLVDANEIKVKVLGTSFVVSNPASRAEARVTVRTGKVAVTPEHMETTVILPHESLLYNKQDNSRKVNYQDDIDIPWTENRFVFRSTPLGEVFHSLESEFKVVVRPMNPEIQYLTFTGTFKRNDNLAEILQIIGLSYNLQIKTNDKQIDISMKK